MHSKEDEDSDTRASKRLRRVSSESESLKVGKEVRNSLAISSQSNQKLEHCPETGSLKILSSNTIETTVLASNGTYDNFIKSVQVKINDTADDCGLEISATRFNQMEAVHSQQREHRVQRDRNKYTPHSSKTSSSASESAHSNQSDCSDHLDLGSLSTLKDEQVVESSAFVDPPSTDNRISPLIPMSDKSSIQLRGQRDGTRALLEETSVDSVACKTTLRHRFEQPPLLPDVGQTLSRIIRTIREPSSNSKVSNDPLTLRADASQPCQFVNV